MRKTSIARSIGLVAMLCGAGIALAFPQPSKYPVSWELKFQYNAPKRIAVEIPGSKVPKAYWYMTYTVTNLTDRDQQFLPTFELVSKHGKIYRGGKDIDPAAFAKIKEEVRNKSLQDPNKVPGTLRVGEDQAKDSVAIWEEYDSNMGSFSIFVNGLSGENTPLLDDKEQPMLNKDGKPILLFKQLQLDYNVAGDEIFPGIDPVDKTNERWVMR